jgi:hypothetical protein
MRYGNAYSEAATAILAGALAQQALWPEILMIDLAAAQVRQSTQAQYIANVLAIAMMETGRPEDAEALLGAILEAAPSHRATLVNLLAVQRSRRQWERVIETAELARSRLPRADWGVIAVHEAAARAELGDRWGAEKLLASIDGSTRRARDEVPVRKTVGTALDDPQLERAAGAPSEDDRVDVAIVTALREEYEAVRSRLGEWRPVPPRGGPYPNVYGWIVGSIAKADGSSASRVVLAWPGHSGPPSTEVATIRTIERWRPRHVLFCGIADGAQGGVVLSETIRSDEHGSFHADAALLASARAEGGAEIRAVEDAAGVCSAIRRAREEDRTVGFATVRGASAAAAAFVVKWIASPHWPPA